MWMLSSRPRTNTLLPDKEIKCPHTGFNKTCREIVTSCTCPKYVHILGANPNTGQPVDVWGCIDSLYHLLLIENSQMQKQTAASCDKVATEVAKFHENSVKTSLATMGLLAQRGVETLDRPAMKIIDAE